MRGTAEKKQSSRDAYVLQVAEETRRCLSELKAENDQLRALMGELRAANARLERWFERETRLAGENQQLTQALAAREPELAAAQSALESHRRERVDLSTRLAEIEGDHRRTTERYVSLERRSARAWALYAASCRLHETLERAVVLQVIEEIVNAVIGSEELAVFERREGASTLTLLAASGVDPAPLKQVQVGKGIIGRAVSSGETYIAGRGPVDAALGPEAHLTACVPLRLPDRVTGAVAIFRLLPQKPALEPSDHELFELLATQAAMALHCTRLHAEAGK